MKNAFSCKSKGIYNISLMLYGENRFVTTEHQWQEISQEATSLPRNDWEWPLVTPRSDQLECWPLTSTCCSRWCSITSTKIESNNNIPGMIITNSKHDNFECCTTLLSIISNLVFRMGTLFCRYFLYCDSRQMLITNLRDFYSA